MKEKRNRKGESMKKILLVAINAKYIHSNLAVYSLKAAAGKYGDQIEIAEYTINQQPDQILGDIYRRKPDVAAFSCYIWNGKLIGELMQELPKILPHTEIWAGGPEVSYDAEKFLKKHPEIRGVMRAEGEGNFPKLASYYIEETGVLSEIENLTYRDMDGNICETPWAEPISMDEMPFAYENLHDFEHKIIYYESSRGCPFRCSYCLSSIDKRVRFRSLDLVKKELQVFLDARVPQVKFVDRTFNCNPRRTVELLNWIQKHDNGVTNFHFEIAADITTEEELAIMEQMRPGLIQLEIGVQSTNPKTVEAIHRTMDLTKLAEVVSRVKGFGNIHQHLDLIAGLPYENYESFGHSFNEVYAMHPDQLQLGFLKVLHGSFMYDNAEAYGLVWQDRPPYEVLFTDWLPYGDVIRLKKVEEMVEVHYNSGQFANTMEHLVKEFPSPFDLYVELGEYYEKNGLFGINHSRLARYENLWQFIRTQIPDRADSYREWLTLDLYLRENVKNRPAFAGENQVTKEEMTAFYREETETHRYLKEYDGFDARQLRKMTHLEKIDGKYLLFDYRNRSRLSQNAATYEVCFSNE